MSAANRVRVIGYTIQPQIVIDDGENLTPYPVQPLHVPAAEWQDWVEEGLPAALAEIEAQVNQTG